MKKFLTVSVLFLIINTSFSQEFAEEVQRFISINEKTLVITNILIGLIKQ